MVSEVYESSDVISVAFAAYCRNPLSKGFPWFEIKGDIFLHTWRLLQICRVLSIFHTWNCSLDSYLDKSQHFKIRNTGTQWNGEIGCVVMPWYQFQCEPGSDSNASAQSSRIPPKLYGYTRGGILEPMGRILEHPTCSLPGLWEVNFNIPTPPHPPKKRPLVARTWLAIQGSCNNHE